MKMRRGMVAKIHLCRDPKKMRNFQHSNEE